jgi:hypothetical protein
MRDAYIADKGQRSIRIYTADDDPRLVTTIRLADSGNVDDLLRAYGYSRTTPWAKSDDTPDDHTVAALVKI